MFRKKPEVEQKWQVGDHVSVFEFVNDGVVVGFSYSSYQKMSYDVRFGRFNVCCPEEMLEKPKGRFASPGITAEDAEQEDQAG